MSTRVQTDGKFFSLGGNRFPFRGVTYGTFIPRDDGELFPEREQIKRDFDQISAAGFTVVRTYTAPPEDLLDLAADWNLRILGGVFYRDWRYLVGASRRQCRRIAREARTEVRDAARRMAGSEQIAALCVGNEVPADAVRWVGTETVANIIGELTEVVREEDPEMLVTYANYPSTEYLTLPSLDFVTFNVFLEKQTDLRRYLTRIHHLAGDDRPVVLGEIGLHAEDEARQAEVIEWQLKTALERGIAGTCLFSWTDEWWVGGSPVEGWKFGLTKADRSPRAALRVARKWNSRSVADLDYPWPSISVVICAHNAEATLEETLRHTCKLDYEQLEIVVVDDGSSDRTAQIARSFSRPKLVQIPHSGLSAARNYGFQEATGRLVAFLDADAYPPPEWPYYIALGVGAPDLYGCGGPNLPPPDDPIGAHKVARAPGGPVHVLLSDDRAEHIPGCNMAFWNWAIDEAGGFDPVYASAGDDVDFCWKVLERGGEIGFHPAAFVWHHNRPTWRGYLRQQLSYGRSEALVESRHPDRFTPLRTARWRGRIYESFSPAVTRQRIYRGTYGSAAFQSVYRSGGDRMAIAHQAGIPAALALVATAPLALLHLTLGIPAVAGLLFLLFLGGLDLTRAQAPRGLRSGVLRFRAGVVALGFLQPIVRLWGRWHAGRTAWRDLPQEVPLPGSLRRLPRTTLLLPTDRPRPELTHGVIANLRRAGMRIESATEWEDYDARLIASSLVAGELLTSGYPEGSVQLRVRRRVRAGNLLITLVGAICGWLISPPAGVAVLGVAVFEVVRGLWRTGPLVRRIVRRATEVPVTE